MRRSLFLELQMEAKGVLYAVRDIPSVPIQNALGGILPKRYYLIVTDQSPEDSGFYKHNFEINEANPRKPCNPPAPFAQQFYVRVLGSNPALYFFDKVRFGIAHEMQRLCQDRESLGQFDSLLQVAQCRSDVAIELSETQLERLQLITGQPYLVEYFRQSERSRPCLEKAFEIASEHDGGYIAETGSVGKVTKVVESHLAVMVLIQYLARPTIAQREALVSLLHPRWQTVLRDYENYPECHYGSDWLRKLFPDCYRQWVKWRDPIWLRGRARQSTIKEGVEWGVSDGAYLEEWLWNDNFFYQKDIYETRISQFFEVMSRDDIKAFDTRQERDGWQVSFPINEGAGYRGFTFFSNSACCHLKEIVAAAERVEYTRDMLYGIATLSLIAMILLGLGDGGAVLVLSLMKVSVPSALLTTVPCVLPGLLLLMCVAQLMSVVLGRYNRSQLSGVRDIYPFKERGNDESDSQYHYLSTLSNFWEILKKDHQLVSEEVSSVDDEGGYRETDVMLLK